MLLAELEVFHSRPIAPTRRVALGVTVLPCTPAPGYGGILLGAVVARFAPEMDPDLVPDLVRLTHQLEGGHRIPQPRLRHRFQDDRIGLGPHRHRLLGGDDGLRFALAEEGKPEPHVLGAVYAAGRLDPGHRAGVFAAIRRGLRWTGEIGPALVDHLSDRRGTAGWATLGGRDPVLWALDILGLDVGDRDRGEVQRRFREELRLAHPDHGGTAAQAAQRIGELTEARRILLA